GVLWKPSQNVLVNVAVWTLFLEQEFVYVGDAGVVEPSGKTWRSGVDAGVRFQITKGLFMYSDFTYAYARSVDEEEGENYIPLAPIFTLTGGITYNTGKGFYGGLHYRGMGDRPANEDYSVVAQGYNVFDGNIGYAFSKIDIAFSVQNLLNTEWNETQFNTESRLYDEPAPVEEIHFTPGTPFAFKCSFQYAF
ncbi:MAG: TonB-dependent receptor, partial [Chitinophagales bacterium]|nr:TonB-dependent receptor [Chitinophagales bacterium]